MTPDILLSLLTIALASSWTPGPNNALVAASAATFGLRRSLPHVAGIGIGFAFMILVVGLFLGELFRQSMVLREALRWGGAALLLWVAWKIATAGGIEDKDRRARPFTFLEAAAFQWINPKAWVMALAISAQFVRAEAPLISALWVAAAFIIAGLSSAFGWAALGQALRRWLAAPQRLRLFNRLMALIIAAGVVFLFLD